MTLLLSVLPTASALTEGGSGRRIRLVDPIGDNDFQWLLLAVRSAVHRHRNGYIILRRSMTIKRKDVRLIGLMFTVL
jgi:hypothetical protein